MWVLIFAVEKTIDLFMMRSPTVQVNSRPILAQEVADAGQVKLSDYKMYMGFVYSGDDAALSTPVKGETIQATSGKEPTIGGLVSCKDIFEEAGLTFTSESDQEMIRNGRCLDPKLSQV